MSSPSQSLAVMSLHRDPPSTGLDRPMPRQPKSPAKLAQLRVQNRRREYLRRNPPYMTNMEHELADPVLYERLVKRFQTHAEREAEGKKKGYGRTLEADLVRGETKLSSLKGSSNGNSIDEVSDITTDGGLGTSSWDVPAESKEHGLELWRSFIRERFIQGHDGEIDYKLIDNNDDYDDVERQDAEDAWFEEEAPSWEEVYSIKQGETGIQDF